ncbi:MAG TPA: response regulator [Thermoanaerobaculia bacterium]|nr:response regulator [Thermoanaerobaculia bacterium]
MILRPSEPSPTVGAAPASDSRDPGQVVPRGRGQVRHAVIADEPRPFRDFLCAELVRLGFTPETFESGTQALDFVREKKAELVILNVYLKGKLGVEISEEIKADSALARTRVVLIGALFRANRFRANPTNLYGADEYIEEQIPAKELHQIVMKLFPDVGKSPAGTEPKEFDEARRLSRLILSDIIIYNLEHVEKGIREGSFFELLKTAVKEGRDYYESRVPLSVRSVTNFFDETLEQFVELKRDELTRGDRGAGSA